MSEFYEEYRNNPESQSNRYRNCKILTDRETGERLLSTREILDVPRSSLDVYHRIENHELNRLDMIAHKYYKNASLWWVIAQANNIYDPFSEIPSGTLLRIPSILSLYGNQGILN